MDVLAERRIPGDPDTPNSDRQLAACCFLFLSLFCFELSLISLRAASSAGLSPGVSERLFTGEAPGRIFFHEIANEILG